MKVSAQIFVRDRLKWFSPLENDKCSAVCDVYNLTHHKNISDFCEAILRNSEIHSSSIRNSFDVHISNIARKQCGCGSFSFKACGFWNDLPEAIKCTHSFTLFSIVFI
jgi:hypothetical protein